MKKTFTKLFVMTLLAAVITIILSFLAIKFNDSYNPLGNAEKVYNVVQEAGADTPGAGEYLLIGGTAALIADFSVAIYCMLTLIIIPVFAFLIMLVLQIIARLFQIGAQERWKCITSKILTYIAIVLQILLFLVYILNIFSNIAANRLILLVALVLYTAYVILSIKNIRKVKTPEKVVPQNPDM